MSSKRPAPPKPSSHSDEWKITDEWGIYDPDKAGIPALFKRLGRPIIRAGATSRRKERRRALRPERSAEGVGLALDEARKRAALGVPADDYPLAGGNPARAMRLALKAQAAVNALGTPAATPYVPPPAEPPPLPPVALSVEPVVEPPPQAAPARKRAPRKAVAPAAAAEPVVAKARTRRAPAKSRTKAAAAVDPAATPEAPSIHESPAAQTVAPAASLAVAVPPPTLPAVRPGPPAPSPRRPRGPVPLAAWARAVAETPAPDPRRSEKRSFWRGIFRIPTEVALVEYAHGCRIHRLLVEAGDDHLPDFI